VQLFLGGKLAVVALDLWGSDTGKPLEGDGSADRRGPGSSGASSEPKEPPSALAGAKKRTAKVKSSAKEPALKLEAETQAAVEPRGLLGPAQWAGLLNLLAGHHPHEQATAGSDDEEENGEGQVAAAADGGDDENDEADDADDDDEEENGDAAQAAGSSADTADLTSGAPEGASGAGGGRFEPLLLVVAAEMPFLWMSAPLTPADRAALAAADAQAALAAQPGSVEAQTAAAAARATAASRAASGLGPGPAVGRRVAASVLARNWTHGGHRNELATLVEALLAWRHGARGRDVLLLCGSGGGCGAGLESTLRAVSGAGPLGRWAAAAGQEPSLGMLCSGPVGCDAPLGPPQGFALAGRAGGVAGRDAAFDLGFSHTKVVREKNYAVVTLGVTPASPAGGSSGAAAESSGGGWTGWWSGAVVGGSRMDDAHPLPHRVQADDADDAADGVVSSADAQQASLRFDLEACGAGRFALAQLRAPPWWPRKFVAASDSKTRNTLRWLICECRGVLSHSQALGTRRRMSLCIVL
jgi:hypothetical protein